MTILSEILIPYSAQGRDEHRGGGRGGRGERPASAVQEVPGRQRRRRRRGSDVEAAAGAADHVVVGGRLLQDGQERVDPSFQCYTTIQSNPVPFYSACLVKFPGEWFNSPVGSIFAGLNPLKP